MVRRVLFLALVVLTVPTFAAAQSPDGGGGKVLRIGQGLFIGLQVLDVTSTLSAVRSGHAREANPLVAPLVDRPAALVAVKAAAGAGALLLTEHLARTRPKTAKVLTYALDGALSAIVISNYRNAAGRR